MRLPPLSLLISTLNHICMLLHCLLLGPLRLSFEQSLIKTGIRDMRGKIFSGWHAKKIVPSDS